MHPEELSLEFRDSGFVALSNKCVFKLTENSPRLKKLAITTYSHSYKINKMLFLQVAANCNQLERLELHYRSDVDKPDKGLEVLSTTCHQLKSLELRCETIHSGLDKLIQANVNLVSLEVQLSSSRNKFPLSIVRC